MVHSVAKSQTQLRRLGHACTVTIRLPTAQSDGHACSQLSGLLHGLFPFLPTAWVPSCQRAQTSSLTSLHPHQQAARPPVLTSHAGLDHPPPQHLLLPPCSGDLEMR